MLTLNYTLLCLDCLMASSVEQTLNLYVSAATSCPGCGRSRCAAYTSLPATLFLSYSKSTLPTPHACLLISHPSLMCLPHLRIPFFLIMFQARIQMTHWHLGGNTSQCWPASAYPDHRMKRLVARIKSLPPLGHASLQWRPHTLRLLLILLNVSHIISINLSAIRKLGT